MDTADRAAITARLLILDALVVMLVGESYVDRHRRDASLDVLAMAKRDVRQWFDPLAEAHRGHAVLEAHLLSESARLLAAIETHVRERRGH